MSLFKISIVTIVLVTALMGLGIYFYPLAEKLYTLVTLGDPDKIAANLQGMEKVADHYVIAKSSAPYPLPKAEQGFVLPGRFESLGRKFDTKVFLANSQSMGMLILHKGQIIYEKYEHGLTESTTSLVFSVSKSFTSALVGLAIADGYIDSEHDPVVKYLPDLKGAGYEKATIADCLEMSSGVKFLERHDGSETDMDRFKRHFALGRPIMDFLKTIGPDKKPGTYNGYNSLDAQVAGMVVDAAIGERTLSEYLQEKIWQPLGMEHDAQWLKDGIEVELSLGGLNVTLRHMAKFGLLFLQEGKWNGKQIIPAAWIEESTNPDAPHLMPGRDNPLSSKIWGYKYLWWIPLTRFGGDYLASGLHDQYIYINPEKSLVIAQISSNYRYTEDQENWKEHHIGLFQTIARSMD